MSGFINYLEEFETKITKKEIKKENPINILNINDKIDSIDKANILIEKLQNWISKQQPEIIKKETYRIPPKKIIKNPIKESTSRAVDILDDLPEENIINTELLENNNQNNINNNIQTIKNIETVSGHASALL